MNTQTQAAGALGSTEGLGPLYAERDHVAQGDYYIRHVMAMTSEGLHYKSAFAAELAHRDMEIDRLRAVLRALVTALDDGTSLDAADAMARAAHVLGPNDRVKRGDPVRRGDSA